MGFLNYCISRKSTLRNRTGLTFKSVSKIVSDEPSKKKITSLGKIVRKRVLRSARIILMVSIFTCPTLAFAADTPVGVNPANSNDVKQTKLSYKILKKVLRCKRLPWLTMWGCISYFCIPKCIITDLCLPRPYCLLYSVSIAQVVRWLQKYYSGILKI